MGLYTLVYGKALLELHFKEEASSTMNQPQISEGDLIAYLAGEILPHVERMLRVSPELQRELDNFRQLDTWLQSQFGGIGRPDPQDLVDVVTGQATKQQELIVAAYVRNNLRGQREIEALQKDYRNRRRLWLPVFVARPVLNYVGLKSSLGLRGSKSPDVLRASHDQDIEQVFEVTELDAQVALRIPRVQGELYELTGTVTQNAQLVENTRVTLRGARGLVRRRITDEAGFFTFQKLPPDTYRLRITREDGVILIPNLELVL